MKTDYGNLDQLRDDEANMLRDGCPQCGSAFVVLLEARRRFGLGRVDVRCSLNHDVEYIITAADQGCVGGRATHVKVRSWKKLATGFWHMEIYGERTVPS